MSDFIKLSEDFILERFENSFGSSYYYRSKTGNRTEVTKLLYPGIMPNVNIMRQWVEEQFKTYDEKEKNES